MKQGFTLIELLIVIVLLGLAIALVGPLTIEQVESSRARNEQQQLVRWLQQQSFNAFAKQQKAEFLFDGKAIYRQNPQQAEADIVTTFDYLFFEPQHITVNHNGYLRPDILVFVLKGREQQINLALILADHDEH